MPARMLSWTFAKCTRAPSSLTVPWPGLTPTTLSINSVRPAPTRPAKPRISPFLSLNEALLTKPGTEKSRTSSTGSCVHTDCRDGYNFVTSRPTIRRPMSAGRNSPAGRAATRRPSPAQVSSSATAFPPGRRSERQRTPEKKVLRDGESRREQDLRMHQNDAAPLGVHRTGERKRRTVNLECPCGRCQVASQDLHQRRFPGAVLADDGMHLAPTDRQRNILQHLDRAKGLAEPLSPQQRRRRALADGLLGAHAILVQTFPFADDLTAASMNCMPASPSLTVGYKTSESGLRPSRTVRMARAASV